MIDLTDPSTRLNLAKLLQKCKQDSIEKMEKYLAEEQDYLFYKAEHMLFLCNKFLSKIEKEHLLVNANTLNL